MTSIRPHTNSFLVYTKKGRKQEEKREEEEEREKGNRRHKPASKATVAHRNRGKGLKKCV